VRRAHIQRRENGGNSEFSWFREEGAGKGPRSLKQGKSIRKKEKKGADTIAEVAPFAQALKTAKEVVRGAGEGRKINGKRTWRSRRLNGNANCSLSRGTKGG